MTSKSTIAAASESVLEPPSNFMPDEAYLDALGIPQGELPERMRRLIIEHKRVLRSEHALRQINQSVASVWRHLHRRLDAIGVPPGPDATRVEHLIASYAQLCATTPLPMGGGSTPTEIHLCTSSSVASPPDVVGSDPPQVSPPPVLPTPQPPPNSCCHRARSTGWSPS